MLNFFQKVCNELNLGKLLEEPTILTGGITNKIYKVKTNRKIYAIKILNKDNISKNKDLLKKIELSEKIAFIASEKINVINAIRFNDKCIQNIDNNYILIYPWCNGKILLTKELTVDNVKKSANVLANLHKIKVNDRIKIEKYKKIDYRKYYDVLIYNNEEWAEFFKDKFNLLINIYDKVYNSYLKLSNQLCYVHKDLNRKNIMWDNNIPYIIDWETATVGNPSLDFFNSAWFLTNDVEYDKYSAFVNEYLSIMKLRDDIENSVYAAIIDECNWLEFSLKRALGMHSKNNNQIELGKESIKSSLTEIINYYDKIPLMLEILKEVK